MNRVSVVVPVYNVAPYLEACLTSIATQTHTELEVIVVDDGSTDDSAAIAADFVDRDRRFRLVQQPNGGLGNARNNGITHATGELLAFVDSDDVLAPRAYELLARALDDTPSDFATGSFRRLDDTGSRPALFAAAAFARPRSQEHITGFHELVVDRTAWNKLFRRSFWDRHGFRFGERVQYEDQYATLPAYFTARSVEVLSANVYFWRLRSESISHGREEPRAVLDRVAAIEWTGRWLVDNGFAAERPWYDASVLRQDLAYVPEVIAGADDEDRPALLDRVTALLSTMDPAATQDLPVEARLAWHLVARRDVDRLRTAVAFASGPARPPKRGLRHWYVDHPLRRDRDLPRTLFRIGEGLAVVSRIAWLERDETRLQITGLACLTHFGAASPSDQTVSVRLRCGDREVPFEVGSLDRPELAAAAGLPLPADGAGFTATLDVRGLRAEDGWTDADWSVVIGVSSRGLQASTAWHVALPWTAPRGVVVPVGGRRQVRAELTTPGELLVHVEPRTATIGAAAVEAGSLRLRGRVRLPGGAGVMRAFGAAEKRRKAPLRLTGSGLPRKVRAELPLDELRSDLASPTAAQIQRRLCLEQWDLSLRVGGRSARPALALPEPAQPMREGDREWLLSTNRPGLAVIIERVPRPVVTGVDVEDGRFVLLLGPGEEESLLLASEEETIGLPVDVTPAGRRLPVPPNGVDVADGAWDVVVPGGGEPGGPVPCALVETLLPTLPLLAEAGGRRWLLGVRGRDCPVLVSVPCRA